MNYKYITINDDIYDCEEIYNTHEKCGDILRRMNNCETYDKYLKLWAEYNSYIESLKSENDFIDFQTKKKSNPKGGEK